ncbi:MAG: hypothetical protein NWS53_12960 [Salibacteraceae bacterium]|jgi:hypothetical protein|nr:hypothetical protein [Salibacteraceae bacterium]
MSKKRKAISNHSITKSISEKSKVAQINLLKLFGKVKWEGNLDIMRE